MTDQEINEVVARKLGHVPGKSSGMPDYCHSIEAAWEILEAVASRGTHWEMSKADSGYTVFIREDDYPYVTEATAPMAICLAFLKLGDDLLDKKENS